MADPRFYAAAGPFTIQELARIAGAEIEGDVTSELIFCDVAPLSQAQPDQVSFLDNRRYLDEFRKSKAGACVVAPEIEAPSSGMVLLRTAEPYAGYAKIAQAFYPDSPATDATASTSSIDDTADISASATVEHGAVISAHVQIGERSHIGANAVIGRGVKIGDDCSIGSNSTLQCCLLGSGVVIHAGVRIGQDGFGFALSADGHLKVPQLGRVIIEDNVEIGANSTIDRGAGPDTIIGSGTKIDNLVQIAHNVKIGRNCVIVSQVGISGSTEIGDFVMIGGQAGLTGHIKIGTGAQIAAQSGVMRDIAPGEKVGGSPSVPMRQWLRSVAMIENLSKKKGR